MRLVKRALISWALAGLWLSAAQASARYEICPAPAWVKPSAPLAQIKTPEQAGEVGSFCLIFDRQIRLQHLSQDRYTRFSKKILTAGGLQDETKLSFDFDPSYEQLQLHEVRIIRGSQSINGLDRQRIKVIQQEEDLDQQLYNGSLTALLFLEDLRVGDIVDYAYTIRGQNPVMAGKFVDDFQLSFEDPVGYLRYRLICPPARKIAHKVFGGDFPPHVEDKPDGRSYEWERRSAAGIIPDEDLPSWYTPYPWVQLSEFQTWAELAQWACPLYSVSSDAGPEIDRLVATWKAKHESRNQAVLDAIRFVQDEVRYLGIEMGPNSHAPRPPRKVLAQRFGDCKDKSTLLVALLRKLGVDSCPALVHTDYDRVLDDWLPSPYAFDHVVVYLSRPSGGFLVDPTRSQQGGSLATMVPARFRRTLMVRPGSVALTALSVPKERGTRHVEETYEMDPKASASAIFNVRTTYSGSEADAVRSEFASSALGGIGKDYLNFYAKMVDGIQMKKAPEIHDDRTANIFRVDESYVIPDLWKKDTPDFEAWAIRELLPNPQTRVRTMPLFNRHPIKVRYTLSLPAGRSAVVRAGENKIEASAFQLVRTTRRKGDKITVDFVYESKAEVIESRELKKNLEAVDDVYDILPYSAPGVGVSESSNDSGADLTLVLLFAIAAGAIGGYFGVRELWRRRSGRSRRRSLARAPGELPETAVPVQSTDEISLRLNCFRCPCGAATDAHAREYHKAIYYERSLIAATEHCGQCGGERTYYFRLPEQYTL